MIYKYIGRHQMNRRSYFCLYVYDNSKEFKIGIAGFSIYGTKSEKLRFYLGSSSRNFSAPPNSKCRRGPCMLSFEYSINYAEKMLNRPMLIHCVLRKLKIVLG